MVKPLISLAGAFLGRHRRAITAAAIFFACLLIFYCFWHLQAAQYASADHVAYPNARQGAFTAELSEGAKVEQIFTFDLPFYALGFIPQHPNGAAAGVLCIELYDGGEKLLARAERELAGVEAGHYAVFNFGKTVQSPGGVYRAVLTARHVRDMNLAKSTEDIRGWQLYENGSQAGGALAISANSTPPSSFLTVFYWVFALCASGFVAGIYLLVALKISVHRLFAAAAAGLGLLFCLVLPPYSSPDEAFHINQSFTVSSFLMGQSPYREEWGTTVRRVSDSNNLIHNQNTTVYTYYEIAKNLFSAAPDNAPAVYAEEGVGGYLPPYWPSAIAVTLCRLLRVGFVPTLFLGRFFNLALYILAVSLAVKITPAAKSVFAVVGLLPMSLHLAASFNRDAITVALYLLYTALCLYYILEKQRIGWQDMLLLAAFVFVIAPMKDIYAPVTLLCLMIPPKKFYWRGAPILHRKVSLFKAGISVLAFLHLLPKFAGLLGAFAAPVYAAPPPFASAAFSPVPPPETPVNPDTVVYTLRDFFTQPLNLVWLAIRSLFTNFSHYLQGVVGGNLSYYSLPLNWCFTAALIFLLFLAAAPEPGEKGLCAKGRLFVGGMAVLSAAFLVVGCILWTPTYYTSIYGIQGRYLLPVLPLALCCAAGAWGGVKKTRALTEKLILAVSAVGVFALLNAFLLILDR